MTRFRWVLSCVLLTLAVAVPARAQQQHAVVAKKPAAGYAGNESCLECHKKEATGFLESGKGKLLVNHPRDKHESLGCESCHGKSKDHAESGGEQVGAMVTFGKKTKLPAQVRNAACLQCHEKTARLWWKGSQHESRDVTCTSCHNAMHSASERASLRKETVLATCVTCHQQRKSQQIRFSHMPLGQGKMDCTSCHNPHGSANEKMLVASSTNAVCTSCHAEKRGPFLWQHAPVTENCANCHDSHGSNKEKMLKVARPRLCQQCHASSGHPVAPRSPGLPQDIQFMFNRQCSNCHVNIHGSNHPAGAFFTR